MIVFESVKYKNFLSTGNVFTEIQLNKHHTTLIVGENGAGKTTIADAITYALFGRPFRNINKPQLINSINEKECVVEITFSVGTKKYKVVRGMKPNVFEIWCGKDLLNQDAKSKDYQDHLEKSILKMNYKSFAQIVILGSTNFTPFMQLSAADRRVVIEDLLDIKIFSAMNSLVKDKPSLLKEEDSMLKVKIEAVKGKIELHKKHLEELKKNNKEIVESKKKEVVVYGEELSKLEASLVAVQDEVDSLLGGITDLEENTNRFKKLNAIESKLESNITKVLGGIDFYANNSTCPTCDQTIQNKEDKVHHCNEKLKELNVGLDKLKEQSNNVINRINTIRGVQKKVSELEQELVRITTSCSSNKKYIRKLQTEISELESKPAMSDDFKAQSKELLNNLYDCNERRKQVVIENQQYEIALQLLKDGGVKSKIIKQYIPVINKLVNKYLSAMDFFVNFSLNEEFKETIKSRHRDEFSYESFSEGEKKRIDLAILFAWRAVAKLKNSVNTNLLIFDEVFDGSLDSGGAEEFMKIINMMQEDTNIIVISHKSDIVTDKFRHTIRFKKIKNFSEMVN